MEDLEQYTKVQLAEMINKLPGNKVSDRPKKSILIEIYRERLEEHMEEMSRKEEVLFPVEPVDEAKVSKGIVLGTLVVVCGIVLFVSYLVG